MSVQRLLTRINQCPNYRTLYALESEFNSAGLTIQATGNNRMILCKLRNSRPVSEEIISDYIFIGGFNQLDAELSEWTLGKICDFVSNNYGDADKVKDTARVWRNGLRMYESSIVIVNEDIKYVSEAINE